MQHELIQEALERSLKEHVAIPLRGSIPCNSGPGSQPHPLRDQVACILPVSYTHLTLPTILRV